MTESYEKELSQCQADLRETQNQLRLIQQENAVLKKKCSENSQTISMALCQAEYLATTRKFKLMHLATRIRRQMMNRNREERKLFWKWLRGRLKKIPDCDRRYNPLFDVINTLNQHNAALSVNTEKYISLMNAPTDSQLANHFQNQNAILDRALTVPDNDEVLRLKDALMNRNYKGILIFPHIVNWEPLQTPQQLLRAFAKAGWLCLFCEQSSLRQQYREVEPNLFISGEEVVLKAIGNREVILMLTWMGSLSFVNRIHNAKIWYHILDHLEIFSYYDEYYLELHKRVLDKATLVSYVAKPLAEMYALDDHAIYLPNAVYPADIMDAIHPDYIPDDMCPILAKKHKIVGYYGYLAEWMDYDLVAWLAQKHPDFEFVFIGKAIHDTSRIEKLPNVHLLGLKPYNELFDYAKFFDVATIPFVVNEKMDCVSPIKFYEYLALGKPIVSSSMPEVYYYSTQCSFVFNALNSDEFSFYLERALLPDIVAEAQCRGIEFANQNSWQARSKAVELSLMQSSNMEISRPSNCPDIIELAIIDYDFRFQRPQHIAKRLEQNGHRVFYVNTAFVSGENTTIEQYEKRLYQVHLPFAEDISIHCTDLKDKKDKLFSHLDRMIHDWVIKDAVVVVDYPNWVLAAEYLQRKYGFRVITDYMDDYTGFLNPAEKIVRDNCVRLLKCSDSIIASSNFLFGIAKKYSDKVMISRNGTEFEYFHKIAEKHRVANERPIIGYYGAIAEWFNVDVVSRCAERFPQCDIVLVGNVTVNRERLAAYPNVRLVGEVPYTELLPWLESFDVCLIPFDTSTDLIKATNPVKFYEYLSAGKKIVATEIPELEPYRDQFVYLENDPERFCDRVELCLSNRDCLADASDMFEFAKQNDWDCRAQDFEKAIVDIYPKISIITLCYNQLEYTKQCVESVLKYTAYPNYEFILVDNNSTDNTAEYLRRMEKESDRVRIVLNSTNRGFAGGNNDGIAISNGEYIVLLNNDTVVTKGWLTGLLKHFNQKEKVAMVGPVTNSIGNEAKILVDYADTTSMPSFAHEYTTKHLGEEYPHRGILAMFCVMISKEFYMEAGPLDENYGIGMFEDDDYSTAALRKGYKLVMAEDVFIHHYGTVSFKKLEDAKYMEVFTRNRKYFEKKWDVEWERQKMRPGVPRS